jgi:hypothetical protein
MFHSMGCHRPYLPHVRLVRKFLVSVKCISDVKNTVFIVKTCLECSRDSSSLDYLSRLVKSLLRWVKAHLHGQIFQRFYG